MTFGVGYGIVLLLFIVDNVFLFHKNTLYVLLLFDLVIAVLAYFVRAPSFVFWDTIRFSQFLDYLRGLNYLGIFRGLEWGLSKSYYAKEPFVVLYLWLFSLFKNNGVLFFATTFFFLFSLTLLIIKAKNKLNGTSKTAIFIQIIILATFNIFFQIEGIRNFLAFIIFATALYFDLNSNSKKVKTYCWLFYILAFLFHPSVLLLLAFRIILAISSKLINFITYFFSVSYSFLLTPIINFISQFPIFDLFTGKFQNYFFGQSNYQSFASEGEILFTSFILVFLILEYMYFTFSGRKDTIPVKYNTFYKYVIFFTVGSFLNTQVYLRTIMLLLFLSIPIKMSLLSTEKSKINDNSYKINFVYKLLLILLAIVMFLWWNYEVYSRVLL